MSMEEPTQVQTEQTETEPDVVVDATQLQEAEAELDAVMDATAEVDADVTNFTAILSDIEHGHGLSVDEAEGRHDLRARFNVDEDFIADHFYTMPNDHAAIFELVYRQDEFKASDDQLFTDVSNTNSKRWGKIESFAQSNRAPIPEHARQKLKTVTNA